MGLFKALGTVVKNASVEGFNAAKKAVNDNPELKQWAADTLTATIQKTEKFTAKAQEKLNELNAKPATEVK